MRWGQWKVLAVRIPPAPPAPPPFPAPPRPWSCFPFPRAACVHPCQRSDSCAFWYKAPVCSSTLIKAPSFPSHFPACFVLASPILALTFIASPPVPNAHYPSSSSPPLARMYSPPAAPLPFPCGSPALHCVAAALLGHFPALRDLPGVAVLTTSYTWPSLSPAPSSSSDASEPSGPGEWRGLYLPFLSSGALTYVNIPKRRAEPLIPAPIPSSTYWDIS